MALKDDVVVRVAQRRDVPDMLALLREDSLDANATDAKATDLTPYYEAWDEIMLDPNAEILVLDVDGRLVGVAQLNYMRHLARGGIRRCVIENVRIAGTFRNQGLGEVLIENCLDMARARGCAVVQLTSNSQRTDAHRFYQRLGFQASHVGMKLYL
jgi:GNAT superfamily N-acetyltransferase